MVLPGFFEKSMKLLDSFPEAGLCCCDAVLTDCRNTNMTVNCLNLSKNHTYISPEKLVKIIRKKHKHIWGHTMIIKKDDLKKAGGWILELKWDIDRFAAYVISFRQGLCYIPEPLASYRVTPTSYSASSVKLLDEQRSVLFHMLKTLTEPSFHDVAPMFRDAAVFYTYGFQAIKMILRYPEFRTFFSFCLLRRAFWWELRRRVSSIMPFSIKQYCRSLRNRPLASFINI
jgi:hypothetical protein